MHFQKIIFSQTYVVCGSQSGVVGWVGLIRTQLISLELSIEHEQTDTALADCSHNIDMENCSKSNKCKFLMDSLFSEVFLIVSQRTKIMIMPITEKVMLRAGCISFRIKLKTQVKMNYNILSPSLGVTISLVLSSSILAVCREQERRCAVRGRHGADRREQQQ